MTGGLLPPYGEPAGDRVDDAAVLAAYLGDQPAAVWSPQFHVEGTTLVAGGDRAMALRLGRRSFLVRVDLPDDLAPARRAVHDALAARGMELFDRETLLAAPVAIQVLGSRISLWDLWGADIDEAFADLRAAAAGEWDDLFPGGPPPVGGPPS
jgi:hypothetical protein